jgi:hypothetical protein
MKKTTIAISLDKREFLGKLKKDLEDNRGHFVDMDECLDHLISFYEGNPE